MKCVVLVSADAEWGAVRQILPQGGIQATRLGETFHTRMGSSQVRFFHGGWGRISDSQTILGRSR